MVRSQKKSSAGILVLSTESKRRIYGAEAPGDSAKKAITDRFSIPVGSVDGTASELPRSKMRLTQGEIFNLRQLLS